MIARVWAPNAGGSASSPTASNGALSQSDADDGWWVDDRELPLGPATDSA